MLLELKNIKKYFPIKKGFLGKEKAFVRAVDDVSLSIPKGENISLVGESGCGKTTLARILLKLLKEDTGSILFEGQDIGGLSQGQFKPYRQHMQMVFQDPYSSLDPRFTVRKILQEAMTLDKHKYKTRATQLNRMEELLAAVNLKGDMLNRYPHEFSGGERQRIAIARAMVMNPKLLILDEAVSSLDVLVQEQILNLLKDLQRKFSLTYLFISHNLKVVRKLSHRIAVMYQGRIVELASTEEIFNNPLHPYTKELLSAAIDYKVVKREKEINISSNACLVDQGKGHRVLE